MPTVADSALTATESGGGADGPREGAGLWVPTRYKLLRSNSHYTLHAHTHAWHAHSVCSLALFGRCLHCVPVLDLRTAPVSSGSCSSSFRVKKPRRHSLSQGRSNDARVGGSLAALPPSRNAHAAATADITNLESISPLRASTAASRRPPPRTTLVNIRLLRSL
eukprot:5679893-Prymnesium_polylepis.4